MDGILPYSFYLNGNRWHLFLLLFPNEKALKRKWFDELAQQLCLQRFHEGFTLWNIHIKTIHKGSFYLPFMNKETHIQSCKRTNKCIKNTSCVWIWDLNTNKTIWRNKTSSSVVYINIDNVPSSPIFHLISWHNYEYCSIHKYTFIIIHICYGYRKICLYI